MHSVRYWILDFQRDGNATRANVQVALEAIGDMSNLMFVSSNANIDDRAQESCHWPACHALHSCPPLCFGDPEAVNEKLLSPHGLRLTFVRAPVQLQDVGP